MAAESVMARRRRTLDGCGHWEGRGAVGASSRLWGANFETQDFRSQGPCSDIPELNRPFVHSSVYSVLLEVL